MQIARHPAVKRLRMGCIGLILALSIEDDAFPRCIPNADSPFPSSAHQTWWSSMDQPAQCPLQGEISFPPPHNAQQRSPTITISGRSGGTAENPSISRGSLAADATSISSTAAHRYPHKHSTPASVVHLGTGEQRQHGEEGKGSMHRIDTPGMLARELSEDE